MSEQKNGERPTPFEPLDDAAWQRGPQNPEMLALLRTSIEARLRGEQPIPATELMADLRARHARD